MNQANAQFKVILWKNKYEMLAVHFRLKEKSDDMFWN